MGGLNMEKELQMIFFGQGQQSTSSLIMHPFNSLINTLIFLLNHLICLTNQNILDSSIFPNQIK